MDLSKAFYILNHSLLFAKLDGYKFSLRSTIFNVNVSNKFNRKSMPIRNLL